MRGIVMLFAALVAAFAEARTQELALWRGETTAALVRDDIELGRAPEPLVVRVGSLRTVKFAPEPGWLDRREKFDRVVWDGGKGSVRVVEVRAPAEMKAGVYACGDLKITVVDRVLPPPSRWKYYLDLWQHPWATARVAGVKPFSPEHYAAMRPVYELLATAGQKTITVPILDRPWDHQCYDAYHSLADDSDFKTFDEYVEFCRSCGLGPDISCYSLCPWALKVTPGTPEFEAHWTPFMQRFVRHLKEKGWYEQTVMAMDEREPEQVKVVVDFVHKVAPGMRISLAGNRKPSDFKGIELDHYCQCLGYVDDGFLQEAAARRAKGLRTTFYVCCVPYAPNTFIDSDPHQAFWLGVYPALAGLDGFLRWAWNSWPKDPSEDASFGFWKAGDTFLCYPNGEPSWRFLELRNGIATAEKLTILRKDIRLAEELARLTKLYSLPEALQGKSNFQWLEDEAKRVVNRY